MISHHLASMPEPLSLPSDEQTRWAHRAYDLIVEATSGKDVSDARGYADGVAVSGDLASDMARLASVLGRQREVLRLAVPTEVEGSFILVGKPLDAMAAVGKIISAAQTDILIVDPYMDGLAVTKVAVTAPEKVIIRLLADEKAHE